MELEKRGLPTLVICSDRFETLGRAQADALGKPELALGIIPHPLGGITDDELLDRCRHAYQAAQSWLREQLPE